ncbi:MAG: MFS transporter [Alphaproteobacteria bacterium]
MENQRKFWGLPLSIWILGSTGFLINLATIMVFSQMPIFMKYELGITEAQIGLIDGFVEFISHFMRIIAGSISDIFQNRKVILAVGYGLSTIIKPLFALCSSVGLLIAIRSLDRITNGLQASPRDALIGDLAPENKRGASYGLSKSFKTAGSVIGATLVAWIMSVTNNNFRFLFMLAFIPACVAFILFMIGVKEPKHRDKFKIKVSRTETKFRWGAFLELKGNYWRIIAVLLIFELAHFGESYLSFRAGEVGVKIAHISFVMVLFNMGQFLISYPIGILSDKFQRRYILLAGFLFMLLGNMFMIYGTTEVLIYAGVFFWGAQMGTTQSVFVSMISDETPQYIRGTAFGIFYLVNGIGILVASKIAGVFWEFYGSTYAFAYSAIMTVVSIVALFVFLPRHNKVLH